MLNYDILGTHITSLFGNLVIDTFCDDLGIPTLNKNTEIIYNYVNVFIFEAYLPLCSV